MTSKAQELSASGMVLDDMELQGNLNAVELCLVSLLEVYDVTLSFGQADADVKRVDLEGEERESESFLLLTRLLLLPTLQ